MEKAPAPPTRARLVRTVLFVGGQICSVRLWSDRLSVFQWTPRALARPFVYRNYFIIKGFEI